MVKRAANLKLRSAIRDLRRYRSYAAIAAAVKVSEGTVRCWVTGKSVPHPAVSEKIYRMASLLKPGR